MKRGIIFVTLLLMVFSMVSYGKKLATLPGLFKPSSIAVDDQHLYVCEGIEVRIYSLKDFSLKAKFGKPGEGPREFRLNPAAPFSLIVYPYTDYLLISSMGKVSFFTKEGKFIKEKKMAGFGQTLGMYQPIGNNFAGIGMAMGDGGSMAFTINIYDADFKKVREIYKQNFMKAGSFSFPPVTPAFFAKENKIITSAGKDFALNILDVEGNKVNTISREYKRLAVGDDYKKGMQDFLKSVLKGQYEMIKQRLSFTDTFPAIQAFLAADGKIYILTYMKKDAGNEFFIYDLKGKFLKRLLVPVKYLNPVMPSPFAIKNDTLYQLIENEDEEEWELHAVEIK